MVDTIHILPITVGGVHRTHTGVQPRAKQHLQDIWMAETKEVAEKAFDF